jgi:hypothetical protein
MSKAPTGPSVQALPGPRKSFAEFQQDNSLCMASAQRAIGDAQSQLNQQQAAATLATVGVAVLSNAFVNGGQGTGQAIGGALPQAVADGANAASANAGTLQQRYDVAFGQCMLARNNVVPGMMPVVVEVQPGRSMSNFDPMVQSAQRELVRTGYLNGGVDGSYGPRTRTAIYAFEQANGMSQDPNVTGSLLAKLRAAPNNSGAAIAAASLVQPVTSRPTPAQPQPALTSPVSAPPAPSGLVAPVTSVSAPVPPAAGSSGLVAPVKNP